MSYYKLLGLDCEPFSTSPDPAFFYLSPSHRSALYRLRIAVELKRGLSIIAGDIGLGKTTMARRISQIFYQDPKIDFHVILNPMHHDDKEFLKTLLQTFHIKHDETLKSPVEYLQDMERYLFKRGVEEAKTVVLLIDEAQLLSSKSLEILRALLNYETNQHKLLQVILVGQMELVEKLNAVPNFWDRISLKIRIPPLDKKATNEMIEYRLEKASYAGEKPLFKNDALRQIFKYSKGYPRRITMLCHDALEQLVMLERKQVDGRIIKEILRNESNLLELVSA